MLTRLAPKPKIRDFPWPYRAMLAISSDLDGSQIELFRDLHRYVNSKASDTRFGCGLGLDVADSFWFYENQPAPGSATATYFADLTGTEINPWAGELAAYIRAGWIDTLHTYGNFNHGGFRIALAERALDIANANSLQFPVWVDHGNPNNIQNVFHKEAQSVARHLPSMRKLGVEFVADPAMNGDFGKPCVIQPAKLADGSAIWSFARSCRVNNIEDKDAFLSQISEVFRGKVRFKSSKNGFSANVWHPPYLNVQLSEQRLSDLAERGGFVIIGQHLQYAPTPASITEDFIATLKRLASYQEASRILVASTARLLRFHVARDYLDYSIKRFLGTTTVTIRGINDPVRGRRVPDLAELAGIQFLIPTTTSLRLFVGRERVPDSRLLQCKDSEGQTVFGFRWHEPDYTDYVKEYAPRPNLSK